MMRAWLKSVPLLFTGLACAAPSKDVLIEDTHVFPESITATEQGALIMGSVKGVVYRAEPGASSAKPWLYPTAENGLFSVLGVLADDARRTLWLCSVPSPLPGSPPAPKGMPSALVAF